MIGALQKRRLIEHVTLLCDCGVGLGPISSALCSSVKQLIGADAGSMFWVDAAGAPQGFYHDTAPAELKDLFITRFDELFGGPDELNFTTYLRMEGDPIAQSLKPDIRAWFMRGNIYKYLCQPLGHEHLLDMRADFDGMGRAVLILWDKEGRPFTADDAAQLVPVRALIQDAIAAERHDASWTRIEDGSGYFVTDLAGRQLVGIDDKAEASLTRSHLLVQHIPMAGQIRNAPAFAAGLAAIMAQAGDARLEFPVPDGRLVAQASPMRTIGQNKNDGTVMYVKLDVEVAVEVQAVNHAMSLQLTPLQRRIALFGMLGRSRAECAAQFSVSEEALKKHLRAIFGATGASNWSDLGAITVTASIPAS